MQRAITADDVREVAAVLVKAAKAGEPWAVKELLNRCCGVPKQQLELSGDMPKKVELVLKLDRPREVIDDRHTLPDG